MLHVGAMQPNTPGDELHLGDASESSAGNDEQRAAPSITSGEGDELRLIRLGRGTEANMPLPPCPYSDNDKIEDGVACYIPDCTCIFTSWGSGLNHLRNFHGVKMVWLHGTYIHDQGKLDLQRDQQKRRQERPEQKESNKKANIIEEKTNKQQLELVKDYGFPPKGDALQMVIPSGQLHLETSEQTNDRRISLSKHSLRFSCVRPCVAVFSLVRKIVRA